MVKFNPLRDIFIKSKLIKFPIQFCLKAGGRRSTFAKILCEFNYEILSKKETKCSSKTKFLNA